MVPSEACYSLIKEAEGLRTSAYLCPAGVWTIGYGHTWGVKKGDRCDEGQADRWLREDAKTAAKAVESMVTRPLAQPQFDALVSFVFNLGEENFRISTLRNYLNLGDFKGAEGEFGKWVMATDPKTRKKIRLPGLVARREKERELFASSSTDK